MVAYCVGQGLVHSTLLSVKARVLMLLPVFRKCLYALPMYKMMLATTTFRRRLVCKIVYDHSDQCAIACKWMLL